MFNLKERERGEEGQMNLVERKRKLKEKTLFTQANVALLVPQNQNKEKKVEI